MTVETDLELIADKESYSDLQGLLHSIQGANIVKPHSKLRSGNDFAK
jgi:hypothetical protein